MIFNMKVDNLKEHTTQANGKIYGMRAKLLELFPSGSESALEEVIAEEEADVEQEVAVKEEASVCHGGGHEGECSWRKRPG